MYFRVFIQAHACVIQVFPFFFKTHIINIIQFVLIKLRFNHFLCFYPNLHFIIFLKNYPINWNINNSIIIFLPIKFLYIGSLVTAFLSRTIFSIIRTKVSQDFAFMWWIPGANYPSYDINIFPCTFQNSHSS